MSACGIAKGLFAVLRHGELLAWCAGPAPIAGGARARPDHPISAAEKCALRRLMMHIRADLTIVRASRAKI
jgi:hypothetical protein